MKIEEIDSLFARLKRLSAYLDVKSGPGTSWKYTFPDGETHTYHFVNVRPPEEIEDNVADMFIWVWSLKDHFKEFASANHLDPKLVEKAIESSYTLRVCGDIANLLKHGRLKRSRSGKFPKLHRPRYQIPQEAIASLMFTEFAVTTNVSRPELVDISVPVEDNAGNEIGDALILLRDAIYKWEETKNQLLQQVPTAPNTF